MSDANYNKIKHLVEVDDDTLAVFTVNSGSQKQMENLSIANNVDITKDFVDYILLECKPTSDLPKRIQITGRVS